MAAPDLDALRAVARSSPWRWRTLQLVVAYRGERVEWPRPVRAWVARPHGLRVEELDGGLISASWTERPWGESFRSLRGRWVPDPPPYGPLDERAPRPVLRPDGLVARRPEESARLRYDDPMFQTYRWVAMLDPVELADGTPPSDAVDVEYRRVPERVPLRLRGAVAAVDHDGRPAWEAVVVPTAAYEPRCTCCPALDGEASHARLAAEAGPPVAPPRRWPYAYRVRLDVGTGVLVLVEELGGSMPGRGWRATVEAVDPELAAGWFTEPPGWQPPDASWPGPAGSRFQPR